jgi:hypothetical protein
VSSLPEQKKQVVMNSSQPIKINHGKKEPMKITLLTKLSGISPILAQSESTLSVAGTESLATASMNEGHGGDSLIGSLAEMNSRAHERERDKAEPKDKSFPPDDPSGDKTVGGILGKSRDASS